MKEFIDELRSVLDEASRVEGLLRELDGVYAKLDRVRWCLTAVRVVEQTTEDMMGNFWVDDETGQKVRHVHRGEALREIIKEAVK